MKKSEVDLEHILIGLIEQDAWMMEVLRAARSLALPDWCIAGGFIRAKVWDHLHGFSDRTNPSDIDLLYFDRDGAYPKNEVQIAESLKATLPELDWEPVNQATVHACNKDAPYSSTAHALSHWAETCNAVGVYLDELTHLRVVAPLGLGDLFGLVVRPNLKSPTAREVYVRRVAEKGWKRRWPKIEIESIG